MTRIATQSRPARRRPALPKYARGQGAPSYDPRTGRCLLDHYVDGKRYRERGDSWPEVEEARDRRRDELARGSTLAGDGTTTLAEAYREWLEYEAPESARGGGPVAPGTMRNHRETLRELEAHELGATLLVELRTRDVEGWKSSADAAAYLGVSRRTIYRLMESKLLAFAMIGDRRRISVAELDRYARRRKAS